MKRRTALAALAVTVALLTFTTIWQSVGHRRPTFSPETTVISPPLPANDFTLAWGRDSVALRDLRDRTVVLFFGYTSCPDVCPLTLQRLARARSLLEDDADRVQVVMVTVDPERDSPQRMRQYVTQFDPTFLGLSGANEDVWKVATAYGIFHARVEREDGGPYTVDHTASVFVLNDVGDRVLLWPHGMSAEAMAADLRTWLRH